MKISLNELVLDENFLPLREPTGVAVAGTQEMITREVPFLTIVKRALWGNKSPEIGVECFELLNRLQGYSADFEFSSTELTTISQAIDSCDFLPIIKNQVKHHISAEEKNQTRKN